MDRSFVHLIYSIPAAMNMRNIIKLYQNVIIQLRKFHDKIETGYGFIIIKNGGSSNV